MNLLELAKLKGEKSISDMSTEELIEHLRATRERRRTPLPKECSAVRAKAPKEAKKAKTLSNKIQDAQNLDTILSTMNKDQLAEFLAKMGS